MIIRNRALSIRNNLIISKMTLAIFINYETISKAHMQFVDTNISYDIYIKIIREEATNTRNGFDYE